MNYYKMSRQQADGTYDLVTGEKVTFTKGYQMSFERPGMSEDKVNELADFFAHTLCLPLYVGVWEGTREVSVHLEHWEEREALLLAKVWNQDAIWDWKNGTAITVK